MKDLFIVLFLLVLAALIVFYLVRQKKNGAKCIGCPYAKNCKGACDKGKE